MELEEGHLRSIPDGGVLHELPNGIRIVRRRKHEPKPIEVNGLSGADLVRRTDRRAGSKFLPETSLSDIVKMTCEVLIENGAIVGTNIGYNKTYEHPIGYSKGRPVKGLHVTRSNSGKLAHAYPIDERQA